MRISNNRKRAIRANDETAVETMDLLFEAEDVADLVSEITGEDVSVEANDDGESVTFTVGEDEYTVEAEGNEEYVESATRQKYSGRIKASRSVPKTAGRVVRRMPRK